MKSRVKTVKVSREWLGTTIPDAIDEATQAMLGTDSRERYEETYGLAPEAALKNIVQSMRNQAAEGE